MAIKIIKIALISAAVALLFFSVWFSMEFYRSPRVPPEKILFEAEKGKGARSIAQNLKEAGIIQKKWPFLLGYKFFFASKTLKAGEYLFSLPISTKEVLETITEGEVYLHPLTIPEGLTIKEIAALVESLQFADEDDFLEASGQKESISSLDKDASSLEGYLLPETYQFPKGTPAKTIVAAMISQFQNVFNDEWRKRASEIGMTIREVVILSSLIEKETSIPEERALVSAVFHNRLKRKMKLDCDPTIIYVLKQEGKFKDRLRTKDLKLDSPYNTYLYGGLPPSPICNPGRDSLEAALYPADSKYLYFVSKNDGSHHFSRTFREHRQAVQKYQKR
jgi:UPF0755 protein